MAQTQSHQFSSQPFSPPVSTPSPGAGSPVNGSIPPPQKRQRLSPHPQQSQSPYASPSFGTLQLPQNPPPTMNGTNVNGMASTPAPAPAPAPPGSMGPPSRPVEKATDAAELTDVLASSGIDVREEEAYLTHSYAPPGAQPQQLQRQQQPPLNASFASQPSTTGTLSATTSFTDPSQPKPPDSVATTEPASQQPAPFKDPNEPTREDTLAARRAQYHLQDPFLLTKVLEQKLQKRGFELGVRIPAEGLFHPVPGRPQPIEVTGPDGSSVIRKGQTILNQEGAPLVDILTLMSLACEERLRMVIDYSATLAKSRRAHSHGAVPMEWKDLAVPASSGVEKAASPKAASLKRPHSATENMPPNPIAGKYRKFMDRDVSSEEARAAKRAKRSANAILGDSASRAGSVDVSGSGAATPTGGIGDKAPGLDKKGLSKKEAKKQSDARASEAQQHQQSIETARMATNSMMSGRAFGSKKTYSWLHQGTSSSGFSTPRLNAATPSAGADKGGRPGDAGPGAAIKRLGDWREDKEKGSGIQVRDILFTLEQDGRGLKHVQKAYSKDLKEERFD